MTKSQQVTVLLLQSNHSVYITRVATQPQQQQLFHNNRAVPTK